jgi:uncharacterized protein YcaQ
LSPKSAIPTLTAHRARLLHLAAQGLLRKPRARATRARVLAAIQRMELLQIDTIHVVARSPYLVLFSRLGPYKQVWLDQLLAKGKLFETWAHEACFAPMSDYALLRAQPSAASSHWAQKSAHRTRTQHAGSMASLLEHIRERGPVKSQDFERTDGEGGGWWGWKSEKRWLEALFALGELMIARREKFQRVYDLRERVLARAGVAEPTRAVTRDEARHELLLRSVRALGVTQARWITDYFRLGRKVKGEQLEPLVKAGELLRVAVAGWDAPGYVHPEHAPLLERAAGGRLRANHSTLLSPFDPVVWDRARARGMFRFDYRIECYTPAPKRKYGYFVLPILARGRLVGRLDAKAHRDRGEFEVKALYLEPGVKPDARLIEDIAAAIRACAEWHGTPTVRIRKCDPKELVKALRQALAADH